MKQLIRIRHRDALGPVGGPYRLDGAVRPRRPSVNRVMADMKALTRQIKATTDDLREFNADLQGMTDRVCAVRDAVRSASPSGSLRDAAGTRVRPMTPTDLQALHDAHYGRIR